MKQNKYDNENFFAAYKQMPRSIKGLEGAGEWHEFKPLIPSLKGKNVLDLGCGFGWHCRFAREQQASSVIGVDISEKMLQIAREKTNDPAISYVQMPIEDIEFPKSQFDVVISTLAFHYIKSFEVVCRKVYDYLKPGGISLFLLSTPSSHPVMNEIGIVTSKEIHCIVLLDHYQSEG